MTGRASKTLLALSESENAVHHGAPQAFPTLDNPELSALPLRVRFLPINFLPRVLRALRVTRGKKFIRTRWHAGTSRWQARPERLVLHFCDCKLGSKGEPLAVVRSTPAHRGGL